MELPINVSILQVETLLANRPPGEDSVGPSPTAVALQQVIVAISSLSKVLSFLNKFRMLWYFRS